MTNCEVTIGRLYGADDGSIVRIDAHDGPRLLGRIEMPLADFAACLMGTGKAPGFHTTVRTIRRPAPPTDGGVK